jgi:hypothetical protein
MEPTARAVDELRGLILGMSPRMALLLVKHKVKVIRNLKHMKIKKGKVLTPTLKTVRDLTTILREGSCNCLF